MFTNKELLRKHYQNIRANILSKQEKDFSIRDRFFDLSNRFGFDSFFVYVSMKNEVDTHLIIKQLLSTDKKVCIPHTKDGIMSVIMLDKMPKSFLTDKLGNLKGVKNMSSANFACDCAVIPLLAFDDELFRIGYGGGYYDRFLKSFEGIKIGLAYDEQYCEFFDREAHDIKLDIIVTPTRLFGDRL